MNAFVDSFATQQLLPPWMSEGCRIWGLIVRVPDETIQGYLDAYLNGAYPDRAPYFYSRLPGPQFGMLNIAIHERVSSGAAGMPKGWDTLKHTEVYWTYPVHRRSITAENLLVDPRIVWVQPFAFDNNPVTVFGSREIWGGNVGIATIVRDPDVPDPGLHLDVALQSFRKFSPRSVSELLACLHVAIEPGGTADLAPLLAANPDLARLATMASESALFAGQSAADAPQAANGFELNNLKQFRDAYHPERAVYRAIVEARTHHIEVDDMTFWNADQVSVDFLWSDSIRDMLGGAFGLTPPVGDSPADPPDQHMGYANQADERRIFWNLPRTRLPVQMAYSYKSNARFEIIDTLHTYGG